MKPYQHSANHIPATDTARPTDDGVGEEATLPAIDYRSPVSIAGWPLIHIARGSDPLTGRRRVAHGIIAIGDIAAGVVAVGGCATGVVALGGLSVGVLSLGGLAVGVMALGGVSLASHFALGGLAASLEIAIGAIPLAPLTLGPDGASPQMQAWLAEMVKLISD